MRELPTSMPQRKGIRRFARNKSPERDLQVKVSRFLHEHMPTRILWTTNAAGLPMSIQAAVRIKDSGVNRGWPDMQFLFGDGITRYIELKIDNAESSLSPEQKAFRNIMAPYGRWARCKSLEEVITQLQMWGVTFQCSDVWP